VFHFAQDRFVSKQDSQFFNVFSVVLGLLVAFAICMFALARHVGKVEQVPRVQEDARYVESVQARTQAPVKVAVAGQDNTGLEIKPSAAAGPAVVAALPTDGASTFETVCKACHGEGIAGAPKVGDKAAWGPRVAQGKDTLYKHAIGGFNGTKGVMPAKGGRTDLSDELIKKAVDHMVAL
jgi:cytochrome c5